MTPSWIELSRSAFHHNVAVIKGHVGNAALMPCIKANAYGHGLPLLAAALQDEGVDWVCVHSATEATAVRKAGYIRQILILGPVVVDDLPHIHTTGARFFLTSPGQIESLYAALPANASPLPIHIKIDTGLHRLGFQNHELPALLEWLPSHPLFVVEGLATHFATADQRPDRALFDRQVMRFQEARALVEKQYPHVLCHVANSSTTLLEPALHFSGVRMGLSLYGYIPNPAIPLPISIQLKPVLEWKTRVSSISNVPAGETVGYGATWQAPAPSRVAVLPIGYYDGVPRAASNVAHVLVRGACAPIAGRVCMNMCMVDVTHIPGCAVGDVVTIIGRDGDESIGADEFAATAQTTAYEALSRLHPEIPRAWVA